ncbi:WD repeat-containing protein 75 [Allomyces arbusculus]|nr:WD repeat-containing protein 75 [Allomyces arbusculus]
MAPVAVAAASPPPTADADSAAAPVLSLSKVVGGQLSAHPPLFTADSAHFLCIASSSIKLFSVRTGQQLRVLSPPDHAQSHQGNVTALALSPKNPLQVYSASVDGTVRLWDINDGALLKIWSIGVPISHFRIHPTNPSQAFLVTNKSSGRRAERFNSVVFSLDLVACTFQRLIKARCCSALDVSPDGTSLMLVARFKLHIGTLVGKSYQWTYFVNDRKLTSVAAHPTEPVVATGDEAGKIKLWSVLSKSVAAGEEPLVQTLHWHARRVNHFCFSHDGRYLLSGGDEAVLVIWQLTTGHKQFISRLGSEILSITVSPDMKLFALAQWDNSIRIISAVNLAVQQSVVGLKSTAINSVAPASAPTSTSASATSAAPTSASAAPSSPTPPHPADDDDFSLDLPAPAASVDDLPLRPLITMEPRHGYIALEGTPGTLQFYNWVADCHVMDVAVVPYNYIPGDGVAVPKVKLLAFDTRGDWMLTVDERRGPHSTLRFWRFVVEHQRYDVATVVHAVASVTSAAFAPNGTVVTTSVDGQFRVWEPVRAGVAWTWRCRSAAYYRNLTPQSAAWSADGSILAVAFDKTVTLWDPTALTLLGTLTSDVPLAAVAFGSGHCPYLVGVAPHAVTVWNLLTLTVAWSYAAPKRIASFAVCKARDQLAVVTDEPESASTRLSVFRLNSPVPLAVHDLPEQVLSVTFAKADAAASVVYLTRENQLKVLAPPKPVVVAKPVVELPSIVTNAAARSVFIRQPTTTADDEEVEEKERVGKSAVVASAASLLEAPAHAIPSVESMFEALMGALLEMA